MRLSKHVRWSVGFSAVCGAVLMTSCGSVTPVQPVSQRTAPIPHNPSAPPMSTADIESRVHQLINAERMAGGLAPLTRMPEIDSLARQHSSYMSRRSSSGNLVISHDGFKSRAGVMARELRFRNSAENVAAQKGWASASAPVRFVDGWMKSKGHLKNIMADYQFTGLGVVATPNGSIFATQLFAK